MRARMMNPNAVATIATKQAQNNRRSFDEMGVAGALGTLV